MGSEISLNQSKLLFESKIKIYFEVVQPFDYLDSIVNISNDIEKEIQVNMTYGNKSFF